LVDGVILGCMRLPVFFNEQTVVGHNLVNTLDKHIEEILENAKEIRDYNKNSSSY